MSEWYQILQTAGRMIKYAVFSGNNGVGRGYVQGPEPDPTLGEQAIRQPVRMMQWFGFRSAPPPQGTECVVVAPRGGATNAICVAADNIQNGPKDLKDGEVAVYNNVSGTIIKLDVDGNVTVIPGSGAQVRLGSGTASELDYVAEFTQLRIEFGAFVTKYNSHSHLAGTLTADATPVTGATDAPPGPSQADPLSDRVASANVLAKKR